MKFNHLTVAILTMISASVALGAEKKLVITGSSTIAPLMLEVGKAFEKKNPGIRVDVQSGGSSRGVSDARQGLADIGMASRALDASESDLKSFTVALDGICIILHSKNPVHALTNQQITDIYTGKLKNWKQVGGNDAPITVINKAEGRSTLELFLQYFKLKNSDIQASVVIGENEQGIKTVAGNANAIGYVSIGTAEFDITQGVAIQMLPMTGVAASIATVKNGKFPLSRPLNLVTKNIPVGLQKQFIEFAQSKEVVSLVQQQYFVPTAK